MPAAPAAAACEGGAASPRAHPMAQPARYAILVAGQPDDAICARWTCWWAFRSVAHPAAAAAARPGFRPSCIRIPAPVLQQGHL